MDYWEGIFLGPVWTDSDVRPRHKRTVLYLFSLIWLLATAFLLVFPQFTKFLPLSSLSSGILGLGLFFILPLAAAYYYRIKLYFRPLILLAYGLSYLLIMNSGIKLVLAKLDIDFYSLPEKFLEFVNLRIEEVARYLKSLEGIEGTIISIVLGVLYVTFIVLGAALLIFFGLCFLIFVLVSLQRIWDKILERILFKEEQ